MLKNRNYVVVDLETTGLSKNKHAITEIGAVRFDGEKIIEEFQTLVNPERYIPTKITKLTGISNEMVENSPLVGEALSNFKDFLKDDIIVAHNATFDFGFLSFYAWHKLGYNLYNDVLCTRKLANRLVPELSSKSLFSLCEYFSVTNDNAHRALSDVYATVEIFSKFLKFLKKKDIVEQLEILEFQDKSIRNCFIL